ncbi:uncharacterized protein LOC144165971 [Haemaphysalis longicornis]
MNFYFFTQVGDKYSVYSIRDDSLTLTVLPSPQSLLASLCDCLHVIKLLLLTSGDVELNPGPTSDSESEATVNSQILKKILKEQTKTNKTLTALSANLKQVELTIGNVQERITSMEKELARLQKCEDKLAEHEVLCKGTKELVEELSAKIEDLENRSRRNNVIIYGLSEEPNEDNKSLRNRVEQEVFKELLSVEVKSIERIHRLGFKHAEKPRPVILRLFDFSEKMKIMASCPKLKGTEISVSEDFSKRLRDLRGKLWRSAAEEKANGAKVLLSFDKLKVDDKVYTWDELLNCRVEVTRPAAQERIEPDSAAPARVTKRRRDKK